jgi:hypothetical protein
MQLSLYIPIMCGLCSKFKETLKLLFLTKQGVLLKNANIMALKKLPLREF